MSPRFLSVTLPAIFVVSLGLGYGLAPRASRPASRVSISTPLPNAAPGGDSSPASPSSTEPPSAASSATSKAKPTADDVFNALGSNLYCERAYSVQEVISQLDAAELQSVLDQIDSVERTDQYQILPRAISRLMELDPERALSWLETNAQTFREGSVTFTFAFEMAYKKNPDGARRVFDNIAPGDRRSAIGEVIARNLAMTDPAAAYKFLENFPKGAGRDLVVSGYVTGLATSNPTSAITQALKWRAGASRKAALTTAFLTLAAAGQGQALAALDQLTNERERGELLGRLASRARQNEIPALAEYYLSTAREHPKMTEWFHGTERVATEFARANPTRALEWAKELPEEQRQEAISNVVSQWGWRQPEAALEWVKQNSASVDDRQKQLDDVYRGWLKTDLPKAQAWAEKLSPGPERDRSTELIVSQLATKGQHTEALDFLQKLPATQQGKLALQVAGNLAWNNPPAASRWLGNIEPDENSASLFGRVAAQWAEKDFKSAANWLGTIPSGSCRDSAVGAYASEVARLDPAAAVEWAASTENEVTRVRTVAEILSEWKERDPKAASQWLNGTNALSPERKAALKEHFQ